MMQLQTLVFLTIAGLTSPALGQLPTSTTSSVTIATAPNTPKATATNLPSLVAQLPPCAIPCFESAAKTINCGATDFSCLCKSGSASSLALNVGGCIGGPQLFGGAGNTDGCDLEDLGNLEKLAQSICAAVAATPAQSDLAAATSIVSGAILKASASASASETGRPNNAIKAGAGTGMLAIVAAYAVFVL